MNIESYLLNLAGEYRVCSELIKRGVFATITYGNRKSADIYVIRNRSQPALTIEVKTSQKDKWVTKIGQTKRFEDQNQSPDFWVLFQLKPIDGGNFIERFFILTHQEICAAQESRNAPYFDAYAKKHGKDFDITTGRDNVRVKDVEGFENQWSKIIDQ